MAMMKTSAQTKHNQNLREDFMDNKRSWMPMQTKQACPQDTRTKVSFVVEPRATKQRKCCGWVLGVLLFFEKVKPNYCNYKPWKDKNMSNVVVL